MSVANRIVARPDVPIHELDVNAYTVPTSKPESDGTLEWDSTTLVTVQIRAGNKTGFGYSYVSSAAGVVIRDTLRDLVIGQDAMNIPAINAAMIRAIRNLGQSGIAMMAVSAVDAAVWDLKAKLFDVPLAQLLGQAKDTMLIYGSGGFTSYNKEQLQSQLFQWVEEGIRHVKIKIGSHIGEDVERVQWAREAIGSNTDLFVDANGAYPVKDAIRMAKKFEAFDVTWFEEPVVAEDHEGLKLIREQAPPSVRIAGGEYAYSLPYFRCMLEDGVVDVLQADATRCGGITGFLNAGALAETFGVPFSSHCAPTLHLAPALSLPSFYIAEYFHDHVRIESMFFDGFVFPKNGSMQPDLSRPGLGVDFKYQDAEKYRV
jgi:L-alanine-DL-glutamate epimerase-like enolase superfamily enzyme